jgi:predicted transcriptional regulator
MTNEVSRSADTVQRLNTAIKEAGYSLNQLSTDLSIPYATLYRHLHNKPECLSIKDFHAITDYIHADKASIIGASTGHREAVGS